jgi:hypothetical protein
VYERFLFLACAAAAAAGSDGASGLLDLEVLAAVLIGFPQEHAAFPLAGLGAWLLCQNFEPRPLLAV